MRQALLGLAAVQLFIGAFMAIAPGSFVDAVAPFGGADSHFIRDLATFQLATGIALLLSVSRPSWRVPVLAFAAIQGVLHTINHLADIGGTDPGWLGPFDFLSLGLLTAATAYVLAAAAAAGRRYR
jgi:hypothetical protein